MVSFFLVAGLKGTQRSHLHVRAHVHVVAFHGVHGVGGTLGAILTGILADEKVNSVVANVKSGLLLNQFKAIAITLVLSVVATTVIAFIARKSSVFI